MEKFPSPIGESYFSINWIMGYDGSSLKIPSPIGESYFSINWIMGYDGSSLKIPSPIGESYFSITKMTVNGRRKFDSVPYRGILFFNGEQGND